MARKEICHRNATKVFLFLKRMKLGREKKGYLPEQGLDTQTWKVKNTDK
jgi:hypothetical protein